jgi:dGTPase
MQSSLMAQPSIVPAASLTGIAMQVERTRGRRHPEAAHPYRNDFQRDRDRIIHSRAFRRLENKTQVFTRRFSDHFRNRLTHTIEVSQISRTVAGALGLNADLTEALALAHDIGHPPFGHAGEKALDAAMRAHGLAFDHNLHALRTVEDFESRYADFRGLNLTFEVREGIIKHSHEYSPREHPELAEYLLELRAPLEAQIIDLTDEIAYNTADLDDGCEAHILTLQQIRSRVSLFECCYQEAAKRYPSAPEKLLFNEALKRMLDRLVTDLIRNTAARVELAGVRSLEAVREHTERLAAFSPAVERERLEAKEFLNQNLYFSHDLNPEKEMAERIITELFEYWIEHPETMPASYQEKSKAEPLPQIICDYIAGMTDHYIHEQHKRSLGE